MISRLCPNCHSHHQTQQCNCSQVHPSAEWAAECRLVASSGRIFCDRQRRTERRNWVFLELDWKQPARMIQCKLLKRKMFEMLAMQCLLLPCGSLPTNRGELYCPAFCNPPKSLILSAYFSKLQYSWPCFFFLWLYPSQVYPSYTFPSSTFPSSSSSSFSFSFCSIEFKINTFSSTLQSFFLLFPPLIHDWPAEFYIFSLPYNQPPNGPICWNN